MSDADKDTSPAGSNPTLETLLAELKAVKSERDNIRSAYNRRDEEVKTLRRQVISRPVEPAYDPPDEDPPARPQEDPDREEMRFRLAKAEFMLENPDGAKRWSEINSIVNDESKVANYAAWDARGRVNYGRVFHDIYRDLEWAEIQKARAAAAANPTSAKPAPSNGAPAAAAAFISGVATAPQPETVNLEDLSPADMRAKGLVTFDPADPIGGGTGSLR